MPDPKPRVRFGEFELDSKAAQLRRGAEVLNLTGQPFRIFELLVARAGEVVTREEIRDAIWPGDYNVEFEAAINVAVRRIREVLGESADAPVYLYTLRGRGYRFELPVQAAEAEAETVPVAPLPPPTATAPPADPAIAPAARGSLPWMVILPVGVLLVIGLLAGSRHTSNPARKIVQFTHSGSVSHVAVSRDGSRIAYADNDKNERVLRVCEAATGKCTLIQRGIGDINKIVFSHDGEYLFFGSFAPGGLFPGSNILRVPAAGGPPVVVIRDTGWLQDVSRDGRQVLYLRRAPNLGDSVFSAEVFGGNERALVKRFSPDRLTVAAWSPDNRVVACWWLVSNNSEYSYSLITARVDSGEETLLSKGPWPGAFPRPDLNWLPDGTGLVAAIVDPESGHRQIYHIAYPSGAVQAVTNELASYSSLALTADSQTLVTVKDDTAPQIWIFDPRRAGDARQITSGLPGYHAPAWTPHGILAQSAQGLWLIDPANGRKQAVAGTKVDEKRPFGSPDGRSVYFESARAGEHAVWKADIDGSHPVQVTHGANGGRPKISRDGRWLAYSAFAPDSLAIWRVAVDGGTPVRVSADGNVTEPDFSPNGKWIAAAATYTRPPEIRIYPFEGGQAVKILRLPEDAQREVFSWTPDGKALTFRRTQGGVTNLWNQPVDGGEPTQVTHFPSHEIPDFAWSTDGRLAIARSQRNADVVMVRHFRNK